MRISNNLIHILHDIFVLLKQIDNPEHFILNSLDNIYNHSVSLDDMMKPLFDNKLIIKNKYPELYNLINRFEIEKKLK